MRKRRIFVWPSEAPREVKHPYRDTLIVYGALAVVILLFAAATGGNIGHALVIAVFFFIAASAWSLLAWRRRLRRNRELEP
jgi:Flp pilus assembly protein TadB